MDNPDHPLVDSHGHALSPDGPKNPEHSPWDPEDPARAEHIEQIIECAVIARLSKIEIEKQAAEQKENNRLQRKSIKVQQWLCFFTACAFGAAAYYAHVADSQEVIMQGQFMAMIGQLATMRDSVEAIRIQTPELIRSADAAKSAADTAAKALEIGNRPWIKVTHRIVSPLDFTFVGAAGPAATITFEDTFENVGQTVALNVFSWEDIIPIDSSFDQTALARQREWCDANRNSDQSRRIGSALFPHSPAVGTSGAAALMSKVNKAIATSTAKGKVGFLMVGCVVYRSSFEPLSRPNHQTRFSYFLGIPQPVGFMPYITPIGKVTGLQLIPTLHSYAAD